MKLKVCGMKYEDNIKAVANLQPDYLGFIFYKKSARYFQNDMPQLPKNIKKVGVFVDEHYEVIRQKIDAYNLDAVQLHGNESPEFCGSIQGVEVIKAFSIEDNFDFDTLDPYEGICDYYLFDTKGKLPGGNGYAFDWRILNNYPSTKPYFLSGGIGIDEIENIQSFLTQKASLYCYAIDVNSRFEIEAGLKDEHYIKQFKDALTRLNS